MLTWEKPFNNDNIEDTEKIEDKDYISELLKWLNDNKKIQKYNKIYDNLALNSKEKVLKITLAWLDWEYKWNLDKKEADAFLFIYVLDFILCINNYKNNEKDWLLILNIKSTLNLLFKLYPWTRNAFSEEEIEIIRKLGKEEKK